MSDGSALLRVLTALLGQTHRSPSSSSLAVAAVPTPNEPRISSPPPAVDDKLDVCLAAFQKAKNLSPELLAGALVGLRKAEYLPDAICEASPSRLEEITGLVEGRVLALKKFVRQWCGNVDAKRAKQL